MIFKQICYIILFSKEKRFLLSFIETKNLQIKEQFTNLLFPKYIIHWMIINRNRQRGLLHPLPACFALFAGSGPTQVHSIVLDTHGGHIGAADIVHLFNGRQYGGTHLTVEVGQRGQALPKHVLSLLGTRLYAGIDTAIDVQSFSVKTIYVLLVSLHHTVAFLITCIHVFKVKLISVKKACYISFFFFKLSHLHLDIFHNNDCM